MINLNQLRAFYQAAKYQNFSRAAKNLFVSQPAVTAQVKLFEDYCGLKLFKKKGRNLYLTDEGKALYDYASKIFEYEKKLEDVLEQLKELEKGNLRLGSARTYARYFMPFLLTGFRETYPHIKIHLDEGSSLDMIQSLIDLKNEVVIIAKPEKNPDITFIPFSREEVVLILSPHHRLASKSAITFEQLADEPIIMKDLGSGTRKLVDELFVKNDCPLNILMETGDAEIIVPSTPPKSIQEMMMLAQFNQSGDRALPVVITTLQTVFQLSAFSVPRVPLTSVIAEIVLVSF